MMLFRKVMFYESADSCADTKVDVLCDVTDANLRLDLSSLHTVGPFLYNDNFS